MLSSCSEKDRCHFDRELGQFIGCFRIRHIEENGAYTVQNGCAAVQSYNRIVESRHFRACDNGLDILILLFNTFQKGGFVMFQFDFIEGRNTILCLKFSEERVAFCFVPQEYIIQLTAKMVKVFLIIMVFI